MRLRTVDFKRLARWCRNARSMAKSCLPKSASQIEVDGLSKAIRLGTEYGLGIIDGLTTGLLNAAQGTYTHECIKRNLATLPERYKVQNCMIEIPSPGLPSLEVRTINIQASSDTCHRRGYTRASTLVVLPWKLGFVPLSKESQKVSRGLWDRESSPLF